MKPRKIINEKVIYKTKRLTVKSAELILADGTKVEWHYPIVDSGVVVVPLDKDNNVYLVKEWRLPYKRDLLQLPAGKCTARKEGERVKQVHKELREEIQMDSKEIIKLGISYASAGIHKIAHYYLAENIFRVQGKAEKGEIIQILKMPLNKAYKYLKDKEETTGYTYLGLLWAMEHLGMLRLS
jgi:ADP-ribose pyrophosphatase